MKRQTRPNLKPEFTGQCQHMDTTPLRPTPGDLPLGHVPRITANSEYVECYTATEGFPGGSMVKNPPASAGDVGSIPGSNKITWRRKWQRTPVFLPGKFYGQRSLVGCSPWGAESAKTE